MKTVVKSLVAAFAAVLVSAAALAQETSVSVRLSPSYQKAFYGFDGQRGNYDAFGGTLEVAYIDKALRPSNSHIRLGAGVSVRMPVNLPESVAKADCPDMYAFLSAGWMFSAGKASLTPMLNFGFGVNAFSQACFSAVGLEAGYSVGRFTFFCTPKFYYSPWVMTGYSYLFGPSVDFGVAFNVFEKR